MLDPDEESGEDIFMELQGLRTLIYRVKDLAEAKNWYTKFLGRKPYFDEPFYVGFNVGGFELGLHPIEVGLETGNNVEAYLGVPNIEKAFKEALELGATVHSEIQDVGEGIKTATFCDPFGNIIGLIENPHFKTQAN